MTTTTVQSANTASLAASQQAAAQSPSIDPNAFLRLLVTELQHQDPTKPMDTSQLVQQLSSMAQVQQSAQMNSRLAEMLDQMTIGQAPALIGRTVVSADGATSGVVASVQIGADGLVATLADGRRLAIGPGVSIR